MTEEKIRPIAEKYVEEFCHSSSFEYTDADLVCAGIGTALIVAREKDKQIEELKKENKRLKTLIRDEHRVGNDKFWQSVWTWKRENTKLLEQVNEQIAQIEKMKCCSNCKKQGSICVAEEY